MADSTLNAIRTKVRRLVRAPSSAQLSDSAIDEYVNTFVQYDFPSHLRLFSLRTVFTFFTQPNVDVYDTNTTDPNNALFNFQNRFIAIHQPIFIAGIQSFFTQHRDMFFASWPLTNSIADTQLRGDGSPGPFNGTLAAIPVMQNNVIFTCLDTSGNSMVLRDYPVSNSTGALGLENTPQTLPSPYGQINYLTGAFTLNFPTNTQVSAIIRAETIPYQPGKPVSMLYYDNKFTLRPIPDTTYSVTVEADTRPVELLASGQSPELEQWWQYIAYGAAKKIFEDRMDLDSVQLIMPEYMKQQNLVNRTSLTQYANERTETIYTSGKTYNYGGWGNTGWPY